jgi:NADH:ubiquinone oxidoreductase subunit 5 (subunit L)/multisubunit Na+/H+ antiporter MnhA subunit
LNKRWLFDKVYNDVFGKNALSFGYNVSFKSVDKGVLEMLGPYGLVVMFKNLSGQFKSLQTGYVYHYAFVMLIGLTFMLALVGLWDVVSVYVDNRLYFIHLVTYLIIQATAGEA